MIDLTSVEPVNGYVSLSDLEKRLKNEMPANEKSNRLQYVGSPVDTSGWSESTWTNNIQYTFTTTFLPLRERIQAGTYQDNELYKYANNKITVNPKWVKGLQNFWALMKVAPQEVLLSASKMPGFNFAASAASIDNPASEDRNEVLYTVLKSTNPDFSQKFAEYLAFAYSKPFHGITAHITAPGKYNTLKEVEAHENPTGKPLI